MRAHTLLPISKYAIHPNHDYHRFHLSIMLHLSAFSDLTDDRRGRETYRLVQLRSSKPNTQPHPRYLRFWAGRANHLHYHNARTMAFDIRQFELIEAAAGVEVADYVV